MKLSTAPLALAGLLLACPSAIAQGQAPSTHPAAGTTPPAASPAPPPPTEKRRAVAHAAHADARVCLEFPNDLQVIACSEKYRWAKSR